MIIQQFKKVKKKVEYFALVQRHFAYTHIETEDEVVEWVINLLAPTAYVECISTDLVSDDLFAEKNLDNIIDYHNKVKSYEQEEASTKDVSYSLKEGVQ